MELRKKWSVTMKNNISGGGGMPPVADPFDPSVFYVSDGWGSYYASIRLRKLSAETGEELSNVLTRDCVRCLHITKERMFAVLNKRILELDRETLEVRRAYKTGVPQGGDYVGFNGRDKLLLMNWMGSFLNIFDLNAEKTQKKKVNSCCGILEESPDSFLVMNGDAILRYDLSRNKLQTLADTKPYLDCARGASGRLYLLGPAEKGVSSKIQVYQSVTDEAPQEIALERPVKQFCLSRDETQLFLLQDNCLWLYSIPEEQTVFRHVFEGEFVFEDGLRVFDRHAILTYRWNEKRLTCWSLEG